MALDVCYLPALSAISQTHQLYFRTQVLIHAVYKLLNKSEILGI